jgi:hypothetical protein
VTDHKEKTKQNKIFLPSLSLRMKGWKEYMENGIKVVEGIEDDEHIVE